jgi:putative phage-type endonuclease
MERITHNIVQKSPEWYAHRYQHENASDAAAMLGCSPHKTRDELLAEYYLGMGRDFSQYVQEIVLDPGHAFEALARELAEEIMGESLFPVTMSYGTLSASLDGLSFDGRKSWEHKRLNAELLAVMPSEFNAGADLPKYHRVQIEHQFMVTDAQETLFTASKWNGDQLLDARHAWCFPDLALREEIAAGWAQFRIDLANYVPKAPAAPKAVGKTMESLPALFVVVEGRVTETNLGPWKETALKAIRSVNRELSSDQDFATAANMLKWCETVESNCDTAREYTLSQTTSIADALKALDDVQAEARTCRLELKKLVDKRKAERKSEIVGDAVAEFHSHVAELNASLAPYSLPTIPADFAGQTARKSSFDSMQSAVNTELARVKIIATTTAGAMKARRALIEAEPDFAFLFNDAASLIQKDAETVALIIRTRIHDHREAKAAEENATRARIAAEEKEKAEAAAREQAAEILRQERAAQAERDEEAAAQARAEAAEREQAAEIQAAEDRRRQDEASKAERQHAEEDLRELGQAGAPVASAVAESIVSSSLEAFESPRRDPLAVPGFPGAGRPATLQTLTPETTAQEERAWINLGKMAEAFGFRLDAEFVTETLGVPFRRTEKAAKFWTESDFKLIQAALVKHVQQACPIPF